MLEKLNNKPAFYTVGVTYCDRRNDRIESRSNNDDIGQYMLQMILSDPDIKSVQLLFGPTDLEYRRENGCVVVYF